MKANLFIAGAVKGGTTWLYDVLSTNQDIFAPKLKEPHFFTPLKYNRKHMGINNTMEAYNIRNTPPGYKPSYIVDGSATYMSSVVIPESIKNYNPNAKIILMLRHPVERAFSQYQMDLREGLIKKEQTFEKTIKDDFLFNNDLSTGRMYIGLGIYFQVVKSYIEAFGRDNVLILSFGELKENKNKVLCRVKSFLDINDSFDTTSIENRKNVAALPKNELARKLLSSDVFRFISKIFPSDFRKLIKEKMLTSKSNLKLDVDLKIKIYETYFTADSKLLFEYIDKVLWNEKNDI
jgi:hypothetical protein